MNRLIQSVNCMFLVLTLAPAKAQYKIILTWGLKSTLYKEETATLKGSAGYSPMPAPGEAIYRYFTYNEDAYYPVDREMESRLKELRSQYMSTHKRDKKATRKQFLEFARIKDPYFLGLVNKLAPVLFFDFVGKSSTEYVLRTITIKTIRYTPYQAVGGFSDKEAWYDVEITPLPGKTTTYNVDKKLRFTGSGSTLLRFRSDNHNPMAQDTPAGNYILSIKFDFLCNGKIWSVATEPFKIDI